MNLPSRCVQIDPFLGRYYTDRSAESIAEEVAAHGFNGVQLVITRDSRLPTALLHALRQRKIHVDYATFCNGTYDTHDLPEGWREWRMVTRLPVQDGYTRLCLNHPGYRYWKKKQITQVLRSHPFDGVHLMEPFWPEYPGPNAPAYACLCKRCRALFEERYSEPPPEFGEEASPRFWRRQPELYMKWVEFRVQSHLEFLQELIHGEGGIRQVHPRVAVAVWILAVEAPNPVRLVREVHGQDVAEVARQVRPDAICLQTHWPDWMKEALPPDYVRAYQPFVQAARAVRPNLPIMIQADIGSQPQNRRSWQWIHAFREACRRVGSRGSTLYEYSLGMYMYTEPPRVLRTERIERSGVLLVFSKRLNAQSAREKSHYAFHPPLQVQRVEVDGNLVRLHTDPMHAALRYRLTVRNVEDDPSVRWLPETPALTLQEQTVTL
ncbi:MAG: N-acyl-D-glucosamine 2-epimerase [bacterium]|nr:N-acyl-D-glucosamine 2-epimerase [bacterium]